MVHYLPGDQYTKSRPSVPTDNAPNLPLPQQLLHRNTTAVNQVLGLPGMFSTFNHVQLKRMRILAITSSSLSLLLGITGIYCLINIDRRRKVFRHDLLFFLIVCGFIKALVLMIYPMVILIRDSVYFNPVFYNILGWFTAYTVEGSDLAIFFFAVHFALLIFRPSHKWRNKRTGNLEGGLYRVRALLWPLTGSVPLLLASLAFVNFTAINERKLLDETTVVLYNQRYNSDEYARLGGYKPYSAWCYLPPYPLWYKLVLSWGPRYFLIIFIITLYATIYVFVLKESRKIKRELGEFKQKGQQGTGTEKGSPRVRRLQFFTRPVMKCVRTIKNVMHLRDNSRVQMDVGINCEELHVPRSFLDVVGEPQNKAVTGNLPENNEDNQNEKEETCRPGLTQINPASLRDANNVDSDVQGYPPPSPCCPEVDNFHNQSIWHDYDEEECVGGDDLYEALSTSPNLPTEASSVESERMGRRISFQEESIENAQRLRPKTSLPGISSFQTMFRPLSHRSGNSQKSNVRQDNKKEELHNVQADFQRQTYAEMKRRRLQIQRNVTLIFIYPFSYIAIWIFPLVVDVTQYEYEIIHGPVVWLAYIATIVQPLNCCVDTLVFLLRESPWRYSWQEVQTKELMDTYMLKGELGENEIIELCSSEWGKRGWYYRGRFERKDCWRHQPRKWKRVVWFLYRLFKGLMSNNYNFEDHCNDEAYWEQYYGATSESACAGGQKHFSAQKERQFSFPSDSTTLSDSAHNNNNQNKQNNVFKKRNSVAAESSYRKVPLFWKMIHFLPMLEAIDLDELNRQLRLRSKDDEFVIPGLQAALQCKTEQVQQEASQPRVFKPGYSLSDKTQGLTSSPSRLNRSPENFSNGKKSVNSGDDIYLKTAAINMDFTGVVRGNAPSSASREPSAAVTNHNESMDMLSFLQGRSAH